MKRALILIALAAANAGDVPDRCGWELMTRWNVFATDANLYITGLNNGVVDAKMRAKLPKEWARVTGCECW